jgi:hypothetical protein
MSMQQIMEMLVEMKATADADREERKADKEKMAADRKADKEDLLTRMENKIDASHKKAEADKEEMLARIKEDRKANQGELLARMDAYHEKRMAMLDVHQKKMMTCLGQTEANTENIEQDPGMMQSAEENQDARSEDVVVMPVGKPRKRLKVWKSTAGRRGEPKELTRGNHGCRRKFSAA